MDDHDFVYNVVHLDSKFWTNRNGRVDDVRRIKWLAKVGAEILFKLEFGF